MIECIGPHKWRVVEEQDRFYEPYEALRRFGDPVVLGERITRKQCPCGHIEERRTLLDRYGLPL